MTRHDENSQRNTANDTGKGRKGIKHEYYQRRRGTQRLKNIKMT
jgi:hypothetical protein